MTTVEKLTLTSDAPGKTMFMLGNEAIARGAIEAGLQAYAAYPGTPSSEISETLMYAMRGAARATWSTIKYIPGVEDVNKEWKTKYEREQSK